MAKKTTPADYDRWESAPGSITIIKSPKKTAKKKTTKPKKK